MAAARAGFVAHRIGKPRLDGVRDSANIARAREQGTTARNQRPPREPGRM